MNAADQSPHYVRSVVETGEENAIVAHEDIYAANGMKLLAKGARVDRRMLERLTGHKLRSSLDLSLAASDTVNPVMIARDVDQMLAGDAVMRTIVSRSGEPQAWKAVVGRLSLPAPLAFRLTVMRSDRPELFAHSLRIALVSCCIALRLGLGDEKRGQAFLAGLCHDMGEMHTDPQILQSGRRVQAHERRFIHVHPLTGYVVLQQMKAVPNEVMCAVLEHHERLDGSGYPNALTGERIGEISRILAVAEMHDAVLRRHDPTYLDVVLRLNHGRLDRACIAALRDLLPVERQPAAANVPEAEPVLGARRLHRILDAWEALRDELAANAHIADLHFVSQRMTTLQSLLLQAGLTPDFLELLDLSGADAPVLRELSTSLQELERLLTDLGDEIARRIPADAPARAQAEQLIALLAQ